MGIIFGQYDGTKSPLMKWHAEYTYERTSNANVHVIMTVVGEIKNHKSTSYMGTGNGATVVVTATVDGVSKTYTLKQANETWQGDVNNPRSCSFEFDVASSTSGVSIPISYSVAPGRWTTASEVPTQSSSFSSPALLYTPSTPTMSNVHLGSSVTIYTNQLHAELTHNIYWSLGGRSGTVGTGVKNSVTFQTNVAWADQIPNATSGVGSIKCDTYAGDVLIGTRTISFTAYVPDEVKPTCSVVVSLVNAYWGLAVKGYTKYKAEVAASGTHGSTISSYYISGGGYASSTPPYTSGVLNTVGDNKITVEVTDSRGRKGTAEATVKVYDYSPPSFSVAEAYRTDANKNKAKDGTYITTKATYSCSSVNGKNSVTCTVQYKKHLDASYTSAGSISSGGSVIFGNGALSLSAPYVVLLTLTDGIRNSSNPVTKEIPVGTMSRSFHIKKGGKGIGFGKIAETDNLVDSAWDVKAPKFQGNLQGDISKVDAVLSPQHESNEITAHRRASNDNLFNNPSGMAGIRNALRFRWYNSYWRIGNIRSSSTGTYGFGFELSEDGGSTYKGVARIGTDGTYYGTASKALDTANINGKQIRCGCYEIPTYSCSTAKGTNYYGNVNVSISFNDATQGNLSARPNVVVLQVLDGTTGVIQIEPVTWDNTGISVIRIHRADSVSNVAGFYISYLAIQ